MKKKDYEELLTLAMSTGADFAEIYEEDGKHTTYRMLNSELDAISTGTTRGIGIRLIKGDDYYYTSTNDMRKSNIKKVIKELTINIKGTNNSHVTLNTLEEIYSDIKIPHDTYPIKKKKDFLLNMDKGIRDVSKKISQVSLALLEDDKDYTIANSKGIYVHGLCRRKR